MRRSILTIALPLPFKLGSVNCYLVHADTGYVLIDTGSASTRSELEAELRRAGCAPGDLRLIILTHGDFDHIGNAAYLRETFGAKIAMHPDDGGMAERGDMFWNRKSGNVVIRTLAPLLFGFSKSSRFEPDMHLDEGADLSEYGWDARVVALPGHSKGSIGILTADGDLLCGDLLDNTKGPNLNSIMDDTAAAEKCIARLREVRINTVYPGHGQPFPWDEYSKKHQYTRNRRHSR